MTSLPIESPAGSPTVPPAPAELDIVVFGGHGDLAQRKLLPSLYELYRDGHLPERSTVIGVGRQSLTDEQYRAMMAEAIRVGTTPDEYNSDVAERFLARICYRELDATDPVGLDHGLRPFLGDAPERPRTFYLATPPKLFGPICQALGTARFINAASRVVVEKPIGRDLESARAINRQISEHFDEKQVFRIDHYLGKETVQNLLCLRFGNSLFEPLWSRGRVEYVQITVGETVGVGDRASYYETAGALRDMVQNHLIQLLCLVAMEPPASLHPDAVRDEKLKVLSALRPIIGQAVREKTVRGQYTDGAIGGRSVQAYSAEPGVAAGSDVETFVALQVDIDNWRWAGVPFYLRTGKRLPSRVSEIIVQFEPVPHNIFAGRSTEMSANRLVIRLQPDEGIQLLMMVKQPGRQMRLKPVSLDLNLATAFSGGRSLSAYERLLLDVTRGDPTLFMRRDEVEAAWTWTDHILRGWEEHEVRCRPYVSGSWGPSKSVQLLGTNGHTWPEDGS
jgi:glucose-6-phosphate 1-dehydrogenase